MTHVLHEEKPAVHYGGHHRKSIANQDSKREMHLEGHVKFLNSIEFAAETMCCRYDNTRRLIAIGLANGCIKVYSTEARSVVYSLTPTGNDSGLPVTSLRWKPRIDGQLYDNLLLATYSSGYVRIWHVTTGQCVNETHEDIQMMACSYNATGERYVVGKSDGKIDVHDGETNKIIQILEPSTNTEVMDGHVMRIFSVVYHPTDENVFVSGGWDDTVQWWDTRISEKYSIKKIVGPHVCGEGIDIHPQTSNMLVASWRKENNLGIYDFGTGKLMASFNSDYDNRSMLYCCQWINRDTFVCGGSHQNCLKYYDVPSRQSVGKAYGLPGAVFSIDQNKHHNHSIVASCASKSLYFIEDTI